mmetsp:Transcript_587/g.1204  ORF Transcript_587/g.1204 Transcript_587/m.1204 type:complete len:360 (+) Transcript_587:75-1154(+)
MQVEKLNDRPKIFAQSMTRNNVGLSGLSKQQIIVFYLPLFFGGATAVEILNNTSPPSLESTPDATTLNNDLEKITSIRFNNAANHEKSTPNTSAYTYSAVNNNITHDELNKNSTEQNRRDQSNQSKFGVGDEQTYLDLFGERAKEILTQHIIPSTDTECSWDWRMGRCEPYCECAMQFLWGDYHLGRSCRRRPIRVKDDIRGESATGETSWEEAWQEVTQRMDSPTFFPTLFLHNENYQDSYDSKNIGSCNLPPESRYILAIQKLTKTLSHTTVVFEQFQKYQNSITKMLLLAKSQGQEQFSVARQHACLAIKTKLEEREKERKQSLVLTTRGMIWFRRLCGSANSGSPPDEIKSEFRH